jgi:hypothetical protein
MYPAGREWVPTPVEPLPRTAQDEQALNMRPTDVPEQLMQPWKESLMFTQLIQ